MIIMFAVIGELFTTKKLIVTGEDGVYIADIELQTRINVELISDSIASFLY